jgi:D-isomer specific 2-hydroxyacid dehydrogenase, NAD binding domain
MSFTRIERCAAFIHTTLTFVNTSSCLMQARKIPAAHASVVSGRWEKSKFAGRSVSGKTLGIIGFGSIGRAVAVRAAAFGMRIVTVARGSSGSSSSASEQQQYNDTPFAGKQILLLPYLTTHLISIGSSAA